MKKNRLAAPGLEDLPGEILFQILGPLPVITILRCTAVCKYLNSLIRSSDFVSHHRRSNASSNRPSLLLRRCGYAICSGEIEEEFSLYSHPELLSTSSSIDIFSPFRPNSDDPRRLRVFGSLHGLICLCDNYKTYAYIIYVWNPLLRRFIELPRPTLTYGNMGDQLYLESTGDPENVNYLFVVLGFGYDSMRDDYKVVRIVYSRSAEPPRRAEVYTLKERCWRGVDDAERALKSCHVRRNWCQCFVDGTIYWPARVGSKLNYILAFHVDDERFSRIELPKELPGAGEPRRISISETKVTGLLTVMYRTASSYEILVKKGLGSAEDSWVRFCSIARVQYSHQVVVGLWRDEKVLLELNWEDDLTGSLELGEDDELCLYDCKTHEIERLGLPGMGLRNRGAAYAADYTASLVLLEPEFGAVPCWDPVTGYSLIRQDMNFGVM
ncbi:unnamed protein product [Linum trigynum]|uniref:F-box domain-containing protein n=1 Tax=Linum trigynum TaxID=586398 RepID=A0AAV2GXW6_9ROSI